MIEKLHAKPDIYRIEVTLPHNPLQYLNSYVIKGKTRNLVIDTGFNLPICRSDLCGGLQALQVDLRRTDLFLTHLHADHTGLVHLFSQAGCPIYMQGDDYDFLAAAESGEVWRNAEERFMREGMPATDIQTQFSNYARAYSPRVAVRVHRVHHGQRLRLADEEWYVIHTPGHTKGQCCLYLPQQEILFTSDHILFDITPNIQIWSNMSNALEEYLKSLQALRDLPVAAALPGHRKGRASIKERIQELRRHHGQRLEEVMRLIRLYPGSTAFDIAGQMAWSMRGLSWSAFPPTQKWFALGEALAHIEYLVQHGEIRKIKDSRQYRYE